MKTFDNITILDSSDFKPKTEDQIKAVELIAGRKVLSVKIKL